MANVLHCLVLRVTSILKWGRSSAGRAPALQAGGQEFDSPRLHHLFSKGYTKQSESFAYSKEQGKHKGVVLKGTSTAVFDDVTQLYTKESPHLGRTKQSESFA